MTNNQQQLWMNNDALEHDGTALPHYIKADQYQGRSHLARPGKKASTRSILIAVVAAIVAAAVVGGVGVGVAMGVGGSSSSNSEPITAGSNVGSTLSPSSVPTKFPTTPAPTKFPTTPAPTKFPTTPAPTKFPTLAPVTPAPTKFPTLATVTPAPTKFPTLAPVTPAPTKFPTFAAVTPAPTKFPAVGNTCATVNVGEVISPFANSYIQLVFTACPSAGGANAFLSAADRWSKIISQNQISSISFNEDLSLTRDICSFMETDVTIPSGFRFSNLIIFVETVPVDQAGGVLASAGPCVLDTNEVFPVAGGMSFDSADIDDLEISGSLDDVVLHEMGHVLGIGTLWELNGLLNNPMLISNSNGDLVVNPKGNPQYNGVNGRDGFKVVKGLTTRPASVPVEDFKFPSENLDPIDGAGSVDGHWDFEDLEPELMVFQIDPSESFHPLSLVTLKSLQDLKYVVDETQADSFSVSRPANKKASKSSVVFDLSGDLPGNHVSTPREIEKAVAARENSGLRGNTDIIILKYNQSVI